MATGPGSVIVGYDGSPDAKRALAWAAAYARTREAPVRVVVATGDMRLRQVTELDQDWERSRVAELTTDVRAAVAAAGAADSGTFGAVPPDLLEGVVLARYWPLRRSGPRF